MSYIEKKSSPAWVLALAFFCGVPAVLAHKPVWSDGSNVDLPHALPHETVELSQVSYYEISSNTPQLWLTFEGNKDQELFLQLGVPVIDRLTDYRPAIAVLGPGWPAVDVPFSLPEGDGGLLFQTAGLSTPTVCHDPFTGTDSWIFIEKTLTLPATGTYYIAAYDPIGRPGKLWVSVGTKEDFGLADVVTLGTTISKVREFHEIPKPYCPFTGFFTLLGVILVTGTLCSTKP